MTKQFTMAELVAEYREAGADATMLGAIALAYKAGALTERHACAELCQNLSFTEQGPAVEAKHQRLLCAKAILARPQP